ncbi:sugar ABC transporter ATP-binding protein [Pseudonocardia ailaonensis]|uniref:Sugar ABC transporter ATP-binding protein n=1 Tax=Pseudonocardia ailaonensis TaxID=367279 RepID=A0ABN2MIA7_9PSEU
MNRDSDGHRAERGFVSLRGVSKSFGHVEALRSVDLDLAAGQIHALMGQNGAGKSTCLGVVAGRLAASTGSLTVAGEEWGDDHDARRARRAGIRAIYQERSLVPTMSAVDNVFLGELPSRGGFTHRGAMRTRFDELSRRLGVRIPPGARADSLSGADQQIVEIMGALASESRLLLLDEPTAVLAPPERERLFALMRDLRDRGLTMILVSHYIDEVLAIADTVTVFRNGAKVAHGPVAEWTEKRLVEQMLGHEMAVLSRLEESSSDAAESSGSSGGVEPGGSAPVLQVSGLHSGDGLRGVDLEVRAGEVVGLAGLVGSKRSTLLRTLAGLGTGATGRLMVGGREVGVPRSPREALRHGIALIPEDRKADGLVLSMGSRDNVMISDLGRCSRRGFVSRTRLRAQTSAHGLAYGITERMLDQPAGELSGGNQQKLLLARWANRVPRVLLADEATRGIDIGGKEQILTALRALADDGLAVVFVSSDLEEVAAVCDRVYVLRDGATAGELTRRHGGITQARILDIAFANRRDGQESPA